MKFLYVISYILYEITFDPIKDTRFFISYLLYLILVQQLFEVIQNAPSVL
mgnify:CR=1 FL=1